MICERIGLKCFDSQHLRDVKNHLVSLTTLRITEPIEMSKTSWERRMKGEVPPKVDASANCDLTGAAPFPAGNTPHAPENGEEMERQFLDEFSDLFPVDIPAISEEAEDEGLFVYASFPKKMQNESSKIRHKIILKNPDTVINKKQ